MKKPFHALINDPKKMPIYLESAKRLEASNGKCATIKCCDCPFDRDNIKAAESIDTTYCGCFGFSSSGICDYDLIVAASAKEYIRLYGTDSEPVSEALEYFKSALGEAEFVERLKEFLDTEYDEEELRVNFRLEYVKE